MANEGSLQRYLFRRATQAGVYARKMQATGRRGFPDVLLAHGGRVIFVELKHPDGGGWLSEIQKAEIAHMRAAGLNVRVIHSKEGVDSVIQAIKGAPC